jgi:uncharacterized membrane protein
VTAPFLTLAVLAVIGLANAVYFTLVTYRVLPADPKWLPRVCRMDEETCATVIHTREARLLGLPNAVYGAAWYAVILAAATWALATGSLGVLRLPLLVASAATVAVSLHLAWVLLFRLRTPCPLCFLGHAVNAGILVTLVSAYT